MYLPSPGMLAFGLLACLCAADLAGQSPPGATPEPSTRPTNIVLIMADDIGVEAFGCYGGTSYRTPNIDRMAKRGMRFTHCYSQPLCTPTRVKLMTGKSNARNYRAFSVLPPGERTFAHLLRAAGYRTAIAGKWQLHAAEHYPEPIRGSGTLPGAAGFDSWCLWQVEKLGSRYWQPAIETNGTFAVGAKDEFGPDRYTKFLIDFIDENANASPSCPFFAYYPMALPHNPFVPTPDSPQRDAKPGPEHFGAMVTSIDRLVGQILAKVEAEGLAESTLILFTADNGTHRKIRSTRRVNGAEITVRGGKSKTLRTGTHVPLLVLWPGTITAGSECRDLIDFADFLPTFADLARAKNRPEPIDGISFLPQLLGRPGAPRDAITCYYHPRPLTRPKSKAIRFAHDRRFKLYDDGRLFDLEADPNEQRPLNDASPEFEGIRQRLQSCLDRMPRKH